MNPSATKPEWDAPKDGDFARYVDRLTAAHVVALPEEPGRVPHVGEMMARAKPVAADKGVPDLQALKAPTVAILSSVQLGFFLLAGGPLEGRVARTAPIGDVAEELSYCTAA